MAAPQRPQGPLPLSVPAPGWIKALLSVFVVWHLGCIIVNVSAAGSGDYQAPPVISRLHVRGGVVRAYLGAIFQTNAYRFYAPNPGPCDLLWIRFKYAEASDKMREIVATRWYEMPEREEHTFRMAFQRDLAACMLLNMFVEPVQMPDTPFGQGRTHLNFNGLGRIAFASYIRHFCRQPRFATLERPGFKEPLVLVGVDAYKVAHKVLEPNDAKLGATYNDPRLYEVFFVGRFGLNGEKEGDANEPFLPQNVDDLFARIVQDDLQPLVDSRKIKIDDPQALKSLIAEAGLPRPFRPALLREPGLLAPMQTRAEIARRFVKNVEANDDQAWRVRLGLDRDVSVPVPPHFPYAGNRNLGPNSGQNRLTPPQQSGQPKPNVP